MEYRETVLYSATGAQIVSFLFWQIACLILLFVYIQYSDVLGNKISFACYPQITNQLGVSNDMFYFKSRLQLHIDPSYFYFYARINRNKIRLWHSTHDSLGNNKLSFFPSHPNWEYILVWMETNISRHFQSHFIYMANEKYIVSLTCKILL